jgi:hypothetical protein
VSVFTCHHLLMTNCPLSGARRVKHAAVQDWTVHTVVACTCVLRMTVGTPAAAVLEVVASLSSASPRRRSRVTSGPHLMPGS